MTEKKRIQINDIRVLYHGPNGDYDAQAIHKAASLVNRLTGGHPDNLKIAKKSVDARRELSFVYSVAAEVDDSLKIPDEPSIRQFSEPALDLPRGEKKMEHRPLIVGFGPAGMFCGLILAEAGFRPVILERGASVEERTARVERFIRDGILDTETNIQFGAGGAGTFSDGKLTTRINDPKIAWVLKLLAELGAPDDILYKAKPHIGTDVLRQVVANADRKIRELGGEILYHTRVDRIEDKTVRAGGDNLPYDALVLAIGHSARDIYAELIGKNYLLEAKPFSVGVRAEHLQETIDKALYHDYAGDPTLGHGEYQLSYRTGDRGCYTFCMCPGGTVVPSASEEGGVVTNGMSTRARDGINANAAVCVSVLPEDYGKDPAGAIRFQRELERKAFEAGGRNYRAPVQTVGDLFSGRCGSEPDRIIPTYRNGSVTPADLTKIFPSFVTDMLVAGLKNFGGKIRGYDDPAVPLTGVETRTSAPVRIVRGDDGCAVGHPGIYPCGEGAGYAGGIVSAAVDGIRIAEKIMTVYRAD